MMGIFPAFNSIMAIFNGSVTSGGTSTMGGAFMLRGGDEARARVGSVRGVQELGRVRQGCPRRPPTGAAGK